MFFLIDRLTEPIEAEIRTIGNMHVIACIPCSHFLTNDIHPLKGARLNDNMGYRDNQKRYFFS